VDRPMGALGTASVVIGAVGLGLRVLWRLRAMEKKRAKAAVVFEKELRRRGFPAHQAAMLRSIYEQGSLPKFDIGRMLG